MSPFLNMYSRADSSVRTEPGPAVGRSVPPSRSSGRVEASSRSMRALMSIGFPGPPRPGMPSTHIPSRPPHDEPRPDLSPKRKISRVLASKVA